MKRLASYKTLAQVMKEVDAFDKKCKRIAQLLGYRSSEIPKTYKQFISLCSSLSIVFLQFRLNQIAFKILNKAVQCDVSIFFEGSVEDRTWHGRALLYCNLGYLMMLINDIPSSLKFLYDSESLILEIREMSADVDYNIEDLTLAHAAITFSILCKIGRISNAEKYLDVAISQFNAISSKERQSRINSAGVSNLYCLLIPALKVINAQKMNQKVMAADIANEVLLKVGDPETAAALLLEKYSRTTEDGMEMINSEEYRSILFVTSFFPFISNNTPVIDFEELVYEQEKTRSVQIDLSDLQQMGNSDTSDTDIYSLIMQDALNNVRNNH